jgi:hypothetical protein
MMKNSKIILIAMLLLPWLTLPLLGRTALKRFLPSVIFMCIFTKILDVIGRRRKWWQFYKGIPPLNSMDIFNLGPYFVTSLWMLKLTYGKFLLYLLSNVALHVLFIFKGLKYTKRYEILSLVKISKARYLGIDFIRALLLYAFQWTKEQTTKYS